MHSKPNWRASTSTPDNSPILTPTFVICASGLRRAADFHLLVDAGIRRADDAVALARTGVEGIVVGLETLTGPEELRSLCERHGADCVVCRDPLCHVEDFVDHPHVDGVADVRAVKANGGDRVAD